MDLGQKVLGQIILGLQKNSPWDKKICGEKVMGQNLLRQVS